MIKEKQQKLEDTSLLAYNAVGDFGVPWLSTSSAAPADNSWFNVRKTQFMRREVNLIVDWFLVFIQTFIYIVEI